MANLKRYRIPSAEGPKQKLKDNSTQSGAVSVFFDRQEDILCRLIEKSQLVLGAVAWLTSHKILGAMMKPKYGCSIVVQKEDFLRPESNQLEGSWKQDLQKRYRKVMCNVYRGSMPEPVAGLSTACDPTVEGVRCVGNYNRDKNPSMPRMHNKFVVFCDVIEGASRFKEDIVVPKSVWTGSMNFTHNATLSFENGVLIQDKKIATAYANEWAQIFALSEPLNWEHDWVAPEFRIGT